MNAFTHVLEYIFRHSFNWLPDKIYLRTLYLIKMNRWLNLKKPKLFQEKIQWLKLFYRNPNYVKLVDKLAVKEYVKNTLGREYVIPTIGVWDNFDDIDFDEMPDKFVLKTTHGGGNCGVVVVKDKNKFDKIIAKRKLEKSLNSDIYRNFREWPYKNVPRRIIAEIYIGSQDKEDLTDYKFFCFDGVPKYVQVIQDRNSQEKIDFFDMEWNHQEFIGLNPKSEAASKQIPKPNSFDEMIRAACILSKGKPFTRVDLYQTEKGMKFGEITFYPNSGFGTFTPSVWNERIGDMINLPN